MFEIVALTIALAGSLVAAIWDLLTTEVPDELLAIMVSFGISIWFFFGVVTGDFTPLYFSIVIGTSLLAFGLLLYKKGSWGGADAWLLAAIAYLIPIYNGVLFMPSFIFNLLVAGSAYMIVYSLVLGLKYPWVFSHLVKDVKTNWRFSVLPSSIAVAVSAFLSLVYQGDILYLSALLILLIFFWRYATVIEKKVFRRRIKTSALKPGDVVEDMIWRGIEEKEIKSLRKRKKYVVIKEGVRFIPAFAIALVLTLLFGNMMFLFFYF